MLGRLLPQTSKELDQLPGPRPTELPVQEGGILAQDGQDDEKNRQQRPVEPDQGPNESLRPPPFGNMENFPKRIRS